MSRPIWSGELSRCRVVGKKLLEHATSVDISIICRLNSTWISHSSRAAQILRPMIYKETSGGRHNGRHANVIWARQFIDIS
jgi:hypothetical protein